MDTYEVQRPDGTKYREIHEKVIREAPEEASSPDYNDREARRMHKQGMAHSMARTFGRNRAHKRFLYRAIMKGTETNVQKWFNRVRW